MTRTVDLVTIKQYLTAIELYLNRHDTECLVIENNEPGSWHLEIRSWKDIGDEWREEIIK